MSIAGSVTHWINMLKQGDPTATQKLWENYFRKLVQRARWKLANAPRKAADEEDVALSAFDSFCRAVEKGRFPQLDDRQDLWQILVLITDRKAVDQIAAEHRHKRGGGKVLEEGALKGVETPSGDSPWKQIVSEEPTPEYAASMAEEFRRLLQLLGDAELQKIAVQKMEGYTHEEIADQLGCKPRTVQRRLELIRRIWEPETQALPD